MKKIRTLKANEIEVRTAMVKDGILVKRFESAADAERESNNYNHISISAACNGRLKSYKGYEWRFIA